MKRSDTTRSGISSRIGNAIEQYSGRIILACIALSLLLIIPLLSMGSDTEASIDPSGEVFDLQNDIDERFESLIHTSGYIVEAHDKDILTQAALWELYQNTRKLRGADERGELTPEDLPIQPYLYAAFNTVTNRAFVGINTIADDVQQVLQFSGTSLETASDNQVKLAIHLLFTNPKTSTLKDFLSIYARSEKRVVEGREIDYWTSPAFIFGVLADNEKLGGGTSRAGIVSDKKVLDKQEFNRNVQRLLRGDATTYRLWGVAIDQNLEAEDEGKTAGLFVMLTVIATVLVVGISLRSYWATALTGAGLGILIIWLKGISNLVGLKGGLIIELIVPIAMIALGVDFAVHAIRRYQEEKITGHLPRQALRAGFVGVLGALVLAMLSDSIAFLANASSGIEAVIHFGIAAAIAAVSAFIVLGVAAPVAMMRLDQLRTSRFHSTSIGMKVVTIVGGAGAATLFGTAVLLLVVGLPIPGVLVLVATIVGSLVAPTFIISRQSRNCRPEETPDISHPMPSQWDQRAAWVASVVTGITRVWPAVLLITVCVTAAGGLLAFKLDPKLDVKDFFDSNSDFVVSLDKLDEHIGDRGGEPGAVYIKGDLTDPEVLAAIQRFIAQLGDNAYIARDMKGAPSLQENLLDALERITGNDYAKGQVAQATNVQITDVGDDGIPDTKEQLKATYDYIVQNGVPLDENTLVYDVGQVREVLFHDLSGAEENVAILVVGIPGTREQTVVKAAREALTEDLKILEDNPAITRVGLTGSPFVRESQLDAATNSLQTSLPIAAVAALVLLLLAMRSLRYAVVTVIPIGLVVMWLYGLMYLMGFSLNFVTATIGAISIGVGIDYSIHMTERFREEMHRAEDKMQALRQAANGTGVALMASAGSSIVGFLILGFAPMPMFSSFGFLTALMIFLALTASLVVLPSLLLLVTPEKEPKVSPNKRLQPKSSG